MRLTSEQKIWLLFTSVFLGIIGIGASKPFYLVNPGEAAFHMRLGRLINTHKQDGFYWCNPLIDNVVWINMRNQKLCVQTEALTRDLQTMHPLHVAVNYRVEEPSTVFKTIGPNYAEVIIYPFVMETVKAVIAQYHAEEFIYKRNEAQQRVLKELRERLNDHGIYLTDVNFVHTDFTDQFIHEVELKQIAEQKARRAKFETDGVREQQEQVKLRAESELYTKKLKAEAEAYGLQLKKEMVTKELIELKKIEMFEEAIRRWDGQMPRMITGNVQGLLPLESVK